MNEFVNYLNTIHNFGGDSAGSLAESQIKSPYFEMIKVDRKLGNCIVDSIKNGCPQAYILTGHAGDGKTSILVQVLKAMKRLQQGEELKDQFETDDLYYVKDMSEIPEDEQVEVLKKTLVSPLNNKTSILISNTGPLLNTYMRLIEQKEIELGKEFGEKERIEYQSALLKQLDQNCDSPFPIADYSCILVNIARIDNVSLCAQVFNKLIGDNLWNSCNSCKKNTICPIKNNRDCVSNQFDRISSFIESYYRYLYENDKRMTVRQMVAQLSYAITGNLSCSYVLDNSLKEPKFTYNFANLFFGYKGIRKLEHTQIEGIKQIQALNLDSIALDIDYDLFVKRDYSCFPINLQEELVRLQKRYRKIYQNDDINEENEYISQIDNMLRKTVRRFYLMYSQYSDESGFSDLLNQIYGAKYSDYIMLISGEQSSMMLRKVQSIVYEALYVKNTGCLPYDETNLPLTLHRKDDIFQNVMLVLGSVNKNELKIKQRSIINRFEDFSNKQQIILEVKDKAFILTLPMITYFCELVNGAISSNNNPALTHGIASLDALLIEQYQDRKPVKEEDCELMVLVNTTKGQKTRRFAFEEGKLAVL